MTKTYLNTILFAVPTGRYRAFAFQVNDDAMISAGSRYLKYNAKRIQNKVALKTACKLNDSRLIAESRSI